MNNKPKVLTSRLYLLVSPEQYEFVKDNGYGELIRKLIDNEMALQKLLECKKE